MRTKPRWLLSFLAVVFLGSLGCESVALVHRPTPEVNGEEIGGEITGVDASSRQITLRPTTGDRRDASLRTVRYDADTQVIFQGRDYPVSALEVGDIVTLQVRQRDRDNFTNLIRVQQNSRDRDYARSSNSRQRIEGTVESISRGGSFELRDQSGENVRVSVSPQARAAVLQQVDRLRRGDYILAEGRYTGRDRFEMDNLL